MTMLFGVKIAICHRSVSPPKALLAVIYINGKA
jgi:hypothetical protein